MLSSWYDMADALVNSQEWWLPTKELHKIKPIKIQDRWGDESGVQLIVVVVDRGRTSLLESVCNQ